ncbi:MAG: hypothetical protein GTN40_05145 [Candidatus Aenigmarchaeota archaeon]|nr:hypothetical protein [Candidatus Aenigmarchaeota archaeon]
MIIVTFMLLTVFTAATINLKESKQTTTYEESMKAFQAAQGGVEVALLNFKNNYEGYTGGDCLIGSPGECTVTLESYDPGAPGGTTTVPHVIWHEQIGGIYQIIYRKRVSSVWKNAKEDGNYDIIGHSGSEVRSAKLHLDQNNNPHIIWEDSSSGNREIWYTKWDPNANSGAGAWTGVNGTTPSDNVSNTPSGAAPIGVSQLPQFDLYYETSTGRVIPHVVWEEYVGSGNRDVYYATLDASNNWQKENILGGTSRDSSNPKIKVDSSGVPHVAWSQGMSGSGNPPDVWYTKKVSGGWKKADGTAGYDNLSSSSKDGSLIYQLVLDQVTPQNPHVFWSDVGNLRYTRWTPGIGWTRADRTTLGYDMLGYIYDSPSYLDVDFDANNLIQVFWETSGSNINFIKQNLSGVWTCADNNPGVYCLVAPQPVESECYLNLGISNTDNNPHLVWRTGPNWQVYYSKWDNSIWVRLDGTAGFSQLSSGLYEAQVPNSLEIDINDKLHLVWQGKVNSTDDLDIFYYNSTVGSPENIVPSTLGDNASNQHSLRLEESSGTPANPKKTFKIISTSGGVTRAIQIKAEYIEGPPASVNILSWQEVAPD